MGKVVRAEGNGRLGDTRAERGGSGAAVEAAGSAERVDGCGLQQHWQQGSSGSSAAEQQWQLAGSGCRDGRRLQTTRECA